MSARKLDAQVRALHRRTGRPVALIGDSEGTMVEKLYLLTHSDAPVDQLVMTSPIVRPGRVFYPPHGDDGWGIATRFALERETALISALAFRTTVHMPLLASMTTRAPTLRRGMLCAIPGVESSAYLPQVNAVAEPPKVDSEIPLVVLPTVHGSIGTARHDALFLELSEGQVPRFRSWEVAIRVARGAAAAWQVPTLPLSLGWGRSAPPAACRGS